MSFLRVAFWLALLVLLLPTDAQQQARLSNFAHTAMERVATFCERNGKTCSVGGELWAIFLKKAEFGVRLVGDLLGAGGRQRPATPPNTSPTAPPAKPPAAAPSAAAPPITAPPPTPERHADNEEDPRGTLTPSDLYHPPWRGAAR